MGRNTNREFTGCDMQYEWILTFKTEKQMRPDGTKKSFAKLIPDHGTLDVANGIGITREEKAVQLRSH
ncbi:hypothetical protein Tco_0076131 [Tanacetum coccineum]